MFFLIPTSNDRAVFGVPWVTAGTITLCTVLYLYGLTTDLVGAWGYRPIDPFSVNLLLSAFVHAGLIHLVGNMVFLWCMGINLEARWGPVPFVITYLVGALIAAAVYGQTHPGSHIPMVGASGAISAAMGAFLVVFHRARIRFLYFYFLLFRAGSGKVDIPAYVVLPLWFAIDLLGAWAEASGKGGGVAYSAHVGGFVFGLVVALGMKMAGLDTKLAETRGADVWDDPSKWTDVPATREEVLGLPQTDRTERCGGCGLINLPGTERCRRCGLAL